MVRATKVSPLGDSDQQLLQQQAIDEKGPGTVLADFETLLRFIGPDGVPVSGKYGLLPMRSLAQLNSQLARPIEIGLKRPQQKSYPHIHGLYLLLRATGLADVGHTGTGGRLRLDDVALQSWRGLNPTERYFTLLESWLLRSRPEMLGERGGWLDLPIFRWAQFFERIPAQGLVVAGNKSEEQQIPYSPGLLAVALLELFGFIAVQHSGPEAGQGWRIARVGRTPLGEAMLRLLAGRLLSDEYLDEYLQRYGNATEMAFGELQPVVQPYFPEWRQNLSLPVVELVDGAYIFRVSLGRRVWRRIAIRGNDAFDSLSDVILQAFAFDQDHLYRFTYRNPFGVPVDINHPYLDEPPFTTEVQIGSIGLKPGATLTYLYDFGDNWRFRVELESIDPVDPRIKGPVILETHGEAPEQYPAWDE
jgi:hypothetical protein